ncbi:MAG: hypothetical protein AAFV01_11705 [Bacteroidota bacterium]
MGQQQLVLLVLGLVIVGLAIVTGIQSFEENDRKSRYDRFTEHAVAVAGDVISWYSKPVALGGLGRGVDVHNSNLSLQQIGRPQTGAEGDDSWYVGLDHRTTLCRESGSVLIELTEVPEADGAIMVQLRLFGVPSECWVLRRSEFSDGVWQYDEGELAKPDGCSWSPSNQ